MVDGGALSLETPSVGGRRDAASGPRWFSFVARRGRGPAGSLWGVGAATEMLVTFKSLRIGGELELSDQPSSGTGAGATARLVATEGRVKGLLVEVGGKSDGLGRTADQLGSVLQNRLSLRSDALIRSQASGFRDQEDFLRD
jgi:hypothetical protein